MRTAEPVRTLLSEQARRYNRQAGELQAGNPHISKVAVPEGARLIRRFERDSGRVVKALRLGAAAMAAARRRAPPCGRCRRARAMTFR